MNSITLLSIFLSLSIQVAGRHIRPEPVIIEGRTMGTTYRIIYFDEPHRRNLKSGVDSLLILVNKAINTYDPTSEISLFNKSENGIRPNMHFLTDIVRKGKKICEQSNGAFDPTVMPLVNAWGFGPEKRPTPSASEIDSLKKIVGYDRVWISGSRICKRDRRVQLDMGGIGQGYGVDVIYEFLEDKGISNMLVELGGEGRALGKNLQKDTWWTIGILDPNSTQVNQFFKAYVVLRNQAFTTSGNYFNYKIIDGRKYGHTIDPSSGYPVQHSLLSASVFSSDCTTADAWATAFMVMGLEKAVKKIHQLNGMEAVLMYSDQSGHVQTYVTSGIQQQVTFEH